MTLEVEVPRISYTGDGVEDTFATGFTFELTAEVTVWRGAPTVTDCCEAPAYDNLLQPEHDYTWLPGDYLTNGGSIVVRPHAVIAADEIVTLMRTTPPDQPEAYGDDQQFTPEQLESTLDRMTRMIQELYNNPLGFLLLGGLAYAWRFYYPDTWGDDTPIDVKNFVLGVTIEAGWPGCVATVESYDAEEKVLNLVNQDAEVVGTITIPADEGAVVVAGGAATFPANGQCRVVPPVSGLGDVTGLAVTFLSTITGA